MDMEQANTKFEVPILAQVLIGFMVSVLVMVGIAGSIYKLVSPDGWIAVAFGHSFSFGAALLAALLGAAAVVWTVPGFAPGQRARIADAVVYSFAAAGVLFLGQLLVLGSF